MQSGNKNLQSCGKCYGEDDNRMVMCDNCDNWYHFACVEVNSAVADGEWNCDQCNHIQPL